MVGEATTDPAEVGDALSAYLGDRTAQLEGSQVTINVDASDRSQRIENAPGGAVVQGSGQAAGEAQAGRNRIASAPPWSRWTASVALIVGTAALVLFLVGEITQGAITAILALIAIAVSAIPLIKA